MILGFAAGESGTVLPLSSGSGPQATLAAVVAVAGLLGIAALAGYGVRLGGWRRGIWVAASLAAALALVGLWKSELAALWQDLFRRPDGERATLLLAAAATAGVALGFGLRASRRQLSWAGLALVVCMPSLLITLRAGAFAELAALGWLFVLAHAIGETGLKWLGRFSLADAPRTGAASFLATAVGLLALMLGALALGMAGWATAPGIIIALLMLTVVLLAPIRTALSRWAALPWQRRIDWPAPALGAVCMLAMLLTIYWVGALAPETGADAVGARVAAPAQYLKAGRSGLLPEMLWSNGLIGAEMLYLLVLPLTGFTAAKVVQAGLGALILAGTLAHLSERIEGRSLPLLLFAFWGSTVVWGQMMWGFVDVVQLFFYFAACLALRVWLEEPERRLWVIIAGLMGAAATSVKLNGAGALVIVGVVVAGTSLYRWRSARRTVRYTLDWMIPAALALLPWLLRSYRLTQNPIFPFASSIFPSPLAPAVLPVARMGAGLNWPAVVYVPWELFLKPEAFGEAGMYHPWLLAGAALGSLGLLWAPRKEWVWLLAGTAAFGLWLVTEQNIRYSLFAVYLLALAWSIGLAQWLARLKRPALRLAGETLMLAALLWGFAIQIQRPSFWLGRTTAGMALPTGVVLGAVPEADYLTAQVPTYLCAQWLNRHYANAAKLWQVPPMRDHLYFEAQTIALPHAVQPVRQPLLEILDAPAVMADPAAIHGRLLAGGYTHLAYSATSNPRIGTHEAARVGVFSPSFERTYLELECADRGLRLYKILAAPRSAAAPARLSPGLLLNGGFESVAATGLPANWMVTKHGEVRRTAGNAVLGLAEGATASQALAVEEMRLYELTIDYRATTAGGTAFTQINWIGATGRLRLFWRQALQPTTQFVQYRYLQIAPAGAATATIYLIGRGIEADNVNLREVAP